MSDVKNAEKKTNTVVYLQEDTQPKLYAVKELEVDRDGNLVLHLEGKGVAIFAPGTWEYVQSKGTYIHQAGA